MYPKKLEHCKWLKQSFNSSLTHKINHLYNFSIFGNEHRKLVWNECNLHSMYTTPYILAHAPPVPSLISRNTGINIAQSTDFIYIQKHKQYSLHRLRQPTNNSYNNVISTGTDVLFQFYNVCTSFKNIQSGTNFLESGCWQDDVWSAVPFITSLR